MDDESSDPLGAGGFFKFREILAVLVAAAVIVLLVFSFVQYQWKHQPNSKAGQFRRSLELVEKGAEQRDREIEELTGAPLETDR